MSKYKIFVLGLLFLLLSLLMLSQTYVSAFGFGFRKNNSHNVPDIGVYKSEIKDTNSYYVGNNDKKVLYLTFDAGYDNGNLSKILDVLREKNVYATFFVTGDFLKEEDLVMKIVNDGHIIGNHTYNHKDITKIGNDKIKSEIEKLEKRYEDITSKKMMKLFRPPEGEFNRDSLMYIKSLGYKTFFWSIAYNDWNTNNQKGWNNAYNSVMNNLHNGAIILLHTVSIDNVNALPKIIDDARKQGYSFENLDKFE